MKVFLKADGDIVDYDIDLSKWLVEGDEVDGATVIYDETSDIQYNGKTLFADRVKLWIGGGTAGQNYEFQVLVDTEAGRRKEVNMIISVQEG